MTIIIDSPRLASLAVPAYLDAVLADAPLAYWRLAETSGTVMADSSGNNHPGTYMNSPVLGQVSLLSSDSNGAVQFTGIGVTADHAEVAPAAWMNTPSFSFEVWFNAATLGAGGHVLLSRRDPVANTGWYFSIVGGRLTFQMLGTGVGAIFGETSFSTQTDTTFHAAVTYNAAEDTLRLFLNGELDAEDVGTTVTNNFATGLWLGENPANEFGDFADSFAGILDEAAFYGKAVSRHRIAAHYAAGSVVPTPETVAMTATSTLTATGTREATAAAALVTASTLTTAATVETGETGTYFGAVMADSPLAYYRLGESSGATSIADSSGNARTGTADSPVTSATGLLAGGNTAIDFNKNNRIVVPYGAWMAVNAFTAEGWINADGTNSAGGVLFGRSDDIGGLTDGRRTFKVYTLPSTEGLGCLLRFSDGTAIEAVAATPIYGITCHVALTWDGTTIRLYKNAVEVYSNAAHAGKTLHENSALRFTIGGDDRNYSTTRADARMAEVAYYGTAHPADRIAARYAAGIAA